MDIDIGVSWNKRLALEFEKPYFKALIKFVRQEYNQSICYPEIKNIFAAFKACSFESLKVVLIGQDPYHDSDQANGLCFSVNAGLKYPPSLMNIFKELNADIEKEIPVSGDLSSWASQGVLLLNSVLTVREHQAGSHRNKGWEKFTDAVISEISEQKQGIVFLLWGGYAQKKGAKIDAKKHLVLTCGHPSPLSANRGYWFGNKHFSQTNVFLATKGVKKIDW